MSVFDRIDPEDWIAHNDLAFAIRDGFPVSDGHSLVISRRRIPDWWQADTAEQAAIFELVDVVKRRLDAEYAPTGYNVGFNAGTSAGQTVDHLHVHVIPRYDGDVEDPTGGIRHVIPGKGNYRRGGGPRPGRPTLVTALDGRLKLELRKSLRRPDLDRIDLLVSFIMRSGLELIAGHLDDALARGAHLRLLTTDYLQITDTSALGYFLDRVDQPGPGQLSARVFTDPATSFHPKAYLFWSSLSGDGVAYVGSSNLSRSGISTGVEWNIRTGHLQQLRTEFDALWADPRSTPLTPDLLHDYQRSRLARRPIAQHAPADPAELEAASAPVVEEPEIEPAPRPWTVQTEALNALTATRVDGHRAGLVVMATGLGKTWLAAFDATRPEFRRVLFVAHRQEILNQARDVFRRITPAGTFTMFGAGQRDHTGSVVFATVQTLHRHLDTFDPEAFDYVIVDEFHHAAADSYRRVLGHFRPRFMLGLTATPERADAADLLALCNDNLVYECGLVSGIRQRLLSPFVYRAIPDVADYEHIPWRSGRFDPEELTRELATIARADQVLDQWRNLGGAERRTLGFCCTIRHAEFMAEHFRAAGVPAVAVHSGPQSAPRAEALEGLASGRTPVVFTVDLFNEGVDVPDLDLVLLLRPTESPVVFFQQLGRGLRTAEGKAHLDVVDLVGNHRSFLRKARLLAGLLGHHAASDRDAVQALADRGTDQPHQDLPEGCSIILTPEVIDLLQRLAGPEREPDRLLALVRQWAEDHEGRRPDALQIAMRYGRALPFGPHRGWFGLLRDAGMLSAEELATLELADGFFHWIEHGRHVKVYELVTLRVLERSGWLRQPVGIDELAASCRWEVLSDPDLRSGLHDAASEFADVRKPTPEEWARYWQHHPVAALCGAPRGRTAWFTERGGRLRLTLPVPNALGPTFDRMTAELVEYRIYRSLLTRTARLGSEQRTFRRGDEPVDASFIVEGDLGVPTGVVINAAGGTRGTPTARNPDYVAGFDLLLERLAGLGAQILDVHIDTVRTRDLKLADRRLDPGAWPYPIDLDDVADLSALRAALLRSMAATGRKPGVRSGGNQRKRTRIVIALPTAWTVPDLADTLATGVDRSVRHSRTDRARR